MPPTIFAMPRFRSQVLPQSWYTPLLAQKPQLIPSPGLEFAREHGVFFVRPGVSVPARRVTLWRCRDSTMSTPAYSRTITSCCAGSASFNNSPVASESHILLFSGATS